MAQATGGNGNPYIFSWSSSSTTGNSITVSPILTTTYTVSLSDGCTSPAVTKQIIISVNPLPNASLNLTPNEGCVPLLVNFNATCNLINATYTWKFGDGVTAIGNSLTHRYTHSGDFDVELKISSDKGCVSTVSNVKAVHVYNQPNAIFTANPWVATITNSVIEFKDLSNGSISWLWDFGDFNGTSFLQNPSYTYSDTGHYITSLIIRDNHSCMDMAYGEITIMGSFTFYIPNSFTPNGDMLNDYFEGIGLGIKSQELTIFDRWGKQFYTEKGLHPKWDGNWQTYGIPCQEDAYVYLITVEDIFGKKHNFKGIVTLYR